MKRLPIQQYTKALFLECQEKKTTKDVYRNLKTIYQLIRESEDFKKFLEDPTIPSLLAKSTLEKILKDKITPQSLNFLLFLIEKKRLPLLRSICESFERFYLESEGIVQAQITSSISLEKEQIKEICSYLKVKLKKEIEPQLKIDATILGGVKVKIGDVIYDYSLRFQLEKFRHSLLWS